MGNPDPITEEAIAWFAREQSDQRTRSDEDRFAHWLKQDPRHEQAYSQVAKLYRAAGPQMTPRPLPAGRPAGAEKTRQRRFLPVKWAVAATLALLAVGTAWVVLDHRGPVSGGSFATAAGAQRTLKLSDGSTITLNTRSEVDIEIGEHHRTVRLGRGEARFQVARDPARPFTVETDTARVHALGTAFDVRVSATGLAVTLLEGRVEVVPTSSAAAGLETVALTAGQRLSLDADSGERRLEAIGPALADAWLHRQLIFDAVPLPEAVEEANRYLSRPVVIEDPSLAEVRVSGVVRAGSLESFVGALESSFPITASIGRDGPVTLVRRAE